MLSKLVVTLLLLLGSCMMVAILDNSVRQSHWFPKVRTEEWTGCSTYGCRCWNNIADCGQLNLTEVPDDLPEHITELLLLKNNIVIIDEHAFKKSHQLQVLELDGTRLRSIHSETFVNLPLIERLVILNARFQEELPFLRNATSLQHLEIDRSRIRTIYDAFCAHKTKLRSFVLRSNELDKIPNLHECRNLVKIDFSYGHIEEVSEKAFSTQEYLIALHLSYNRISQITSNMLKGLKRLQILDLEGNRIGQIHENAFSHAPNLADLNLGGNMFSSMPDEHLSQLRELKVHNNRYLTTFPHRTSFPNIKKLMLSYAYHCCEFVRSIGNKNNSHELADESVSEIKETVIWLKHGDNNMTIWNQNSSSVVNTDVSNTEFDENQFFRMYKDHFDLDHNHNINLDESDKLPSEETPVLWKLPHDIQCHPQPGPFLPCQDLFQWWTLRCGVWIVLLLALLGNGVVIIVLCFSRTKMDVPRFLVCHLAVADFFMGMYLVFLATVDAATLGYFRVYAIRWQFSIGCKIAGFLGVLSSELSVFTLSVITLERYYAITHAMHLNKRLSLRHASYAMTICWFFAFVLAILPIFGVSNYSKFAVCLPFETGDKISMVYVVGLMVLNGLAFTVLMGCYTKMYCSIRGSQAWNSNDSRIAKRMALLVCTDFVCWAPIAFFSLSAVTGHHFLSVEGAKVLTIFALPFNSCANPFLYAIFTKQFKKDCAVICKRLEESKVSRGIGRQRNSSNFSNRQTTPNSNNCNPTTAAPRIKHVHNKSVQENCGCTSEPVDGHKLSTAITEIKDENTRTRQKNIWKLRKMLSYLYEPTIHEQQLKNYSKVPISNPDETKKNKMFRKENTDSVSSHHSIPFDDKEHVKKLYKSSSSNDSKDLPLESCSRKFSHDSDISSRFDSCSTSTFPLSRSSFSSNDTTCIKKTATGCLKETVLESTGNNNLMPPSNLKHGLQAFKQKMRAQKANNLSDDDEVDSYKSNKTKLRRQTAVDSVNTHLSDECCDERELCRCKHPKTITPTDSHEQGEENNRHFDENSQSRSDCESFSVDICIPDNFSKRLSQCQPLPIVHETSDNDDNKM